MTAIRFEDARVPLAVLRHGPARAAGSCRGAGWLVHFRTWRHRAKDRAQLAALGDRMLADLGITRAEAQFLSDKPFWRE